MSYREGDDDARRTVADFLAQVLAEARRNLEGEPSAATSGESAIAASVASQSYPPRSEERAQAAAHEPGPAAAEDFAASVLGRLTRRREPHERYRFQEEIDHGGQGTILRVWDEDLQRPLAMKTMFRGTSGATGVMARDPRSLARFLDEAQVTSQLDHPGVVPVHELGIDDRGRVYFTMKLVQGEDLRAVFEKVTQGREGWTEARALGVLLKVCEAMTFAHAKGVIHRDLKPANVMVGRYGEVHVMDWGLARVLGREDRRDVRIDSESGENRAASSEHGELANQTLDPPLKTSDGHIVGTPSYMPPEQALGKREEIGPHSDVYSVGAMLYHLLAGHVPYARPGTTPSNYAILCRVLQGSPESLHARVPRLPAELLAICDKAMARDWRQRYPDMGALGEDLRAYVEGRVVRAYRVGAWIELKKWVGRNHDLAATIAAGILALVGGLVSSLILKARSDDNAELAYDREQEALARRAEVFRLSAIQRLDDLTARGEALWPAHPDRLGALEQWLEEAGQLVAGLDPSPDGRDRGHRAVLAELRARALPRSDEEALVERQSNPRYAQLAGLTARIDSLRRARAVREGAALVEEPEPKTENESAAELNARAWALVGPERALFGDEARGLVLARMAVERAQDDLELANHGDTLAWAFLSNGLDQDALEASEMSLESAPRERRESFRIQNETLKAAVERHRSGQALAELEQARAEIDAELAVRRTWKFASDDEAWWHRQLQELSAGIEELWEPSLGLSAGISAEHGWGVERRLAWAQVVAERTVSGEMAVRAWERARRSIADPRESPLYGGLEVTPQMGLLPIGPDPHSGLWEFAFLQTGEPPARDGEGNSVPAEDGALVFVLLPGGTFAMGAQAKDPAGRNYDPAAQADDEGPVHDVTLAPFFLSKYEVTQAQWLRLTAEDPSFFNPRTYSPFWNRAQRAGDLTHPVEQVSWNECQRFCRRLGLSLPTEAQWEYAARAGSAFPRFVGEDLAPLARAANLSDLFADAHEAAWGSFEPNLDDGNTVHACVGSYAPNAFGLHDMLGNVWEWCLDAFDGDYYDRSPRSDPLNAASADNPRRVFRGGAFNCMASTVRSAYRPGYGTADVSLREIGFRPARALTP